MRSIASGNTHTAVAAETSAVTWGPAPTCGELGYGDGEDAKRSSTARAARGA